VGLLLHVSTCIAGNFKSADEVKRYGSLIQFIPPSSGLPDATAYHRIGITSSLPVENT